MQGSELGGVAAIVVVAAVIGVSVVALESMKERREEEKGRREGEKERKEEEKKREEEEGTIYVSWVNSLIPEEEEGRECRREGVWEEEKEAMILAPLLQLSSRCVSSTIPPVVVPGPLATSAGPAPAPAPAAGALACCTINCECDIAGGYQCKDGFCQLIDPPDVTLIFRNELYTTLLLGANGPSPVLPLEGTWNIEPGATLTLVLPDDWKQTAQAAECNAAVSGPRFWARTGCNIGVPYWSNIIQRRDVNPGFVESTRPPPANSSVGNGIEPNTYLVATKWIDTTARTIYYKSYGAKWVLLNQNVYIQNRPPPAELQGLKLGDYYKDTTTNRWFVRTQKTQCGTGNCGDQYDCSYSNMAGQAPTSLAEFCFVCGNNNNFYDVSLVDGYNLSVNIQPIGGSPFNPDNPNDPFWGVTGLCEQTIDLKSQTAAPNFFLRNNQLKETIPQATDPILGVFSNCGFYEYPTAPSPDCNPADERCRLWKQFCCQSVSSGQPCATDGDCQDKEACWFGTCQCRAFYACQDPNAPVPVSNATNINAEGQWDEPRCCSETVCFKNLDPAAQPFSGGCTEGECIGDDVVHNVCHKAYSWPNDPETFTTNARQFIITFSPGGSDYPLTRGIEEIPLCSSLDQAFYYDYLPQQTNCNPQGNNYIYTCAIKRSSEFPTPPNWPCTVDNSGASCQGIGTLCRWG